MGQKPRVCSSYFFEMEDGSRIEVRRELFLSWLQRGNYDGYKKEQIQEMGKTPPTPGRQQEPEGSEQSQRKLRMFERALGNFSNEEQSLIYYRYYKGLNRHRTDAWNQPGQGRKNGKTGKGPFEEITKKPGSPDDPLSV